MVTSPFSSERAVYFQRDIFTTSRELASLFRNYKFFRIPETSTPGAVLEDLAKRNVQRLVFSNPYRSPLSRSLYDPLPVDKLPCQWL